jgi:hypothetical protein
VNETFIRNNSRLLTLKIAYLLLERENSVLAQVWVLLNCGNGGEGFENRC